MIIYVKQLNLKRNVLLWAFFINTKENVMSWNKDVAVNYTARNHAGSASRNIDALILSLMPLWRR